MTLKFKYKTILSNIKKKSLINCFNLFLTALLLLGSFSKISAFYPLTPTQFDDGAGLMHVVTDENGHAMVAYKSIFLPDTISTYYYSGGVWNLTDITDAIGAESVTGLVMSPAGTALLTYTVPIDNDPDPFTYDIHSRYFDGAFWNTPVTDPIAVSINDPGTLSMNANGYAVTSWSDDSDNIRTATFNAPDWNTPSGALDIGIGANSKVAVNNSDTIVVAWEDITGAVLVSHYYLGIWSAVPTSINSSAILTSVGIANNENSLVLVQQAVDNLPDLDGDLFASYFIADTLDSTTKINPPQAGGSPANYLASLQMSENGTAIAAWYYGFGNFLYYAYFNGSTWASAVLIQSVTQPSDLGISIDGNGDAIIFWGNESDPPDTMEYLTAILPAGGVLTTPVVVATSLQNSSGQTIVSLADNGFNALAWLDGSGEGPIPFGLAAIPGPAVTNLTAFTCNDRLLSQQDCINTVTWNPSTDPNIFYYDVIKDGVYIVSIDADQPLIYIDNAPCLQIIVYTITPFDVLDYQGESASVTVAPCGCL